MNKAVPADLSWLMQTLVHANNPASAGFVLSSSFRAVIHGARTVTAALRSSGKVEPCFHRDNIHEKVSERRSKGDAYPIRKNKALGDSQ